MAYDIDKDSNFDLNSNKDIIQNIETTKRNNDKNFYETEKSIYEQEQSKLLEEGRANRIKDKVYEDGELRDDEGFKLFFKNLYNSSLDTLVDYNPFTDSTNASNTFKFDTYKDGVKVDYRNQTKDNEMFDRHSEDSLSDLVDKFSKIKDNPNAKNVFYTTKHFDGFNKDGSKKYLYKNGIAKTSVWDRYKNQFDTRFDEIVSEKRFAGAEEFEHSFNRLSHKYRALDIGTAKNSKVNFGSGYTELRTKDILGVDKNKKESDYIKNLSDSQKFSEDYIKGGVNKSDSAVDALQSGASRLTLDLLDLGLTVLSLGILKDNVFDVSQESLDKFHGYDRRGVQAATVEAVEAFKQGDYWSMIVDDFKLKAVNTTAESLPEMLMLIGSGGTSASLKIASGVKKLNEAKSKIKALQGVARTPEVIAQLKVLKSVKRSTVNGLKAQGKAGKLAVIHGEYTATARVLNTVANNKGFGAIVAKNTNNIVEERIKNGDDVSLVEIAAIGASQFLLTGIDRFVAKDILLNNKLADAFKGATSIATESGKKGLSKAIASTVIATAKGAGEEVAQESLQTWGEILGKDLGVDGKTFMDILSDEKNQDEVLGAAILGGLSGGLMSSVMATTGEVVQTAIRSIDEEEEQAIESPYHNGYTEITSNYILKEPSLSPATKLSSIHAHLDPTEEHTIEGFTSIKESISDIVESTSENIFETIGSHMSNEEKSNLSATMYEDTLLSLQNSYNRDPSNEDIKNSIKDITSDKDLPTSVKDSIVFNEAMNLLDGMNTIRQQQMSGSIVNQSETSSNDSILEGADRVADKPEVKNILKGKLNGIIQITEDKLKTYEELGYSTAPITEALSLLKKYNTMDEYNYKQKKGIDVTVEANSLGFMFENGTIGRPSIDAYSRFLPSLFRSTSTLTGETSVVSKKQFRIFVNSRAKKSEKMSYLTASTITNIYKENSKLIDIANNTLAGVRQDEGISEEVRASDIKYLESQIETLNSANSTITNQYNNKDKFKTNINLKQSTDKDIVDITDRMNNATTPLQLANAMRFADIFKMDDDVRSSLYRLHYVKGKILEKGNTEPKSVDFETFTKLSDVLMNAESIEELEALLTSTLSHKEYKLNSSQIEQINDTATMSKLLMDGEIMSDEEFNTTVYEMNNQTTIGGVDSFIGKFYSKKLTYKQFQLFKNIYKAKVSNPLVKVPESVTVLPSDGSVVGVNSKGEAATPYIHKEYTESTVYDLNSSVTHLMNNPTDISKEQIKLTEEAITLINSLPDSNTKIDVDTILNNLQKSISEIPPTEPTIDEEIEVLTELSDSLMMAEDTYELSDKEKQVLKIANRRIKEEVERTRIKLDKLKNIKTNLSKDAKRKKIKSIKDMLKEALTKIVNVIKKTSSVLSDYISANKSLASYLKSNKISKRSLKASKASPRGKAVKSIDIAIDVAKKEKFKEPIEPNKIIEQIHTDIGKAKTIAELDEIFKNINETDFTETELNVFVDLKNKRKSEVNNNDMYSTKSIEELHAAIVIDIENIKQSIVTDKNLRPSLQNKLKELLKRTIVDIEEHSKTLVGINTDIGVTTQSDKAIEWVRNTINKLKNTLKKILKLKSIKEEEAVVITEAVNSLTSSEFKINDLQAVNALIQSKVKIPSAGEVTLKELNTVGKEEGILSKVFKSSKNNNNLLKDIPYMFSLYKNKFIKNKIENMAEINNLREGFIPAVKLIGSSLPKLGTLISPVKTYTSETVTGLSTYLTDKGTIVNALSDDHVDVMDIFAKDITVNTVDNVSKTVTYNYTSTIQEAIKIGMVGLVANVDNVRFNILGKSNSDLTKETGLSGNALENYKEALLNGYVPKAVILKEIETIIDDMIGLDVDKDYDVEIKDALIKSVTLHTYSQLMEKGLVDQDVLMPFGAKSFNMFNLNNKNVNNVFGNIEELANAFRELGYVSSNTAFTPPSREPIEDTDILIHNSNTPLAKDKIELLKDKQSTAWNFHSNIAQFAELFNSSEEGSVIVMKAFGYIPIDPSTMPIAEIVSQKSRNNEVKRELVSLFTHFNSFKNDDGNTDQFYLKYGITKSLRELVKGDLNYKDSKIHREFIYTDKYKNEINATTDKRKSIKDIDETDLSIEENLEIALSQTFGLDPDKNGKHQLFKSLREIVDIYTDGKVTMHDLSESENISDKDKPNFKALKDFVEASEFRPELLEAVFSIGGVHAVKAALTLRELNTHKINDSKEPYISTLSYEADAITSGMVLTMLKLGTKKAMELAEKGGVYNDEALNRWTVYTKHFLAKKHNVPEEEIVFSAGALIEAGKFHKKLGGDPITVNNINFTESFQDIYETIGNIAIKSKNEAERENKDTSKGLQMLSKAVGELDSSTVRKLSKSPVMVYNYGSLVSSIMRKLSSEIAEKKFLESLLSEDPTLFEQIVRETYPDSKDPLNDLFNNNKNFKVYNIETGLINTPSKENFLTMSFSQRKMAFVINEELTTKLLELNNLYIGNHYATAFNQVFNEVDTVREGSKLVDVMVSTVFRILLKREVSKIKKDNNGVITKTQLKEVIASLERQGLGHTLDIGESLQPFYSTDNSKSKSRVYTKLTPNSIGYSSNLESFSFVDNSGALATIPTHATDGRVIYDAVSNQELADIYDAILLNGSHSKSKEVMDKYNVSTIQTSQDYNDFGEYVKKLENMLKKVSQKELYEEFKTITTAVDSEVSVEQDVPYYDVKSIKQGKDYNFVSILNKQKKTHTVERFSNGNINMTASTITKKGEVFTIKNTEGVINQDDTSKMNVTVTYRNSNYNAKKSSKNTPKTYKVTYTIPIEETTNNESFINAILKAENNIVNNKVTTSLTSLTQIIGTLDTGLGLITDTDTHSTLNFLKTPIQDIVKKINKAMGLLQNGRDSLYGNENSLHVNHIHVVGAVPIKVDIHPKKFKMSTDNLTEKLTPVQKTINSSETIYFKNKYKDSKVGLIQEFVASLDTEELSTFSVTFVSLHDKMKKDLSVKDYKELVKLDKDIKAVTKGSPRKNKIELSSNSTKPVEPPTPSTINKDKQDAINKDRQSIIDSYLKDNTKGC